MKVKLLSNDSVNNIMEFVFTINKTNNLTAYVEKTTHEGKFIITVESLNKGE